MSAKHHINPRFRAYGKARLDVTLRAKDEQEWQEMWREPLNPFPFKFASGWKFCLEYKVEDYAAEVGFFIDVLGFTVTAFSPRFAQFISPGEELCLNVLEAAEGASSTPPDCIRLILQLTNAKDILQELDLRGIAVEKADGKDMSAGSTPVGYFRTPQGLRIDLWDQPLTSYRVEEVPKDRSYIETGEFEDEVSMPAEDEFEETGETFSLEGLDEDEADRLINELLGLSQDSENEEDDLADPGAEDQLGVQTYDDPEDDEPDPGIISRPKTMHWKPAGREQLPEGKTSRSPAGTSHSRSTNWPKTDDRRNGELSYEEIDDEY